MIHRREDVKGWRENAGVGVGVGDGDGDDGALFIHDRAGRLIDVTVGWQEAVGVDEREILGSTGSHLVHPDDLRVVAWPAMQAWCRGKAFTSRVRIRDANGVWCWWVAHNEPMFTAGGMFAGYSGGIVKLEATPKLTDRWGRPLEASRAWLDDGEGLEPISLS